MLHPISCDFSVKLDFTKVIHQHPVEFIECESEEELINVIKGIFKDDLTEEFYKYDLDIQQFDLIVPDAFINEWKRLKGYE